MASWSNQSQTFCNCFGEERRAVGNRDHIENCEILLEVLDLEVKRLYDTFLKILWFDYSVLEMLKIVKFHGNLTIHSTLII